MKCLIPFAAGSILLAYCISITAEESKTGEPRSVSQAGLTYNLDVFCTKVGGLVRRYYSEADVHCSGDEVHFEHNTELFVVRDRLKTGGLQDASEERGPKPGGIYGDIRIMPGAFTGAAALPQSFDRGYFTSYLIAPYSEKIDAHLNALIKFPADVPGSFIKDLVELLNHFEHYVAGVAHKSDTLDSSSPPR